MRSDFSLKRFRHVFPDGGMRSDLLTLFLVVYGCCGSILQHCFFLCPCMAINVSV